MKKFILVVTLLIAIPELFLNAQDKPRQDRDDQERQERFERFRSMKIAYYSERIEFTSEEAEQFWPVYNEFDRQTAALNRQSKAQFRDFESKVDAITEEQVEEMIDQYVETQKKQAQLAEDFHAQFKKILPPKKIMTLYITEVQFREDMLRRLRDDRDDSSRRHPPPQQHP
jgi:hypothetical protein